jgi:hypothetical protein
VTHPLADGVQGKHAPAVLANRLLIDQQWGRPCLAYNVCLLPGAAVVPLSAIQGAMLHAEPSLLRIPERALHVSVVWLLPVHEEFDQPKDELWQRLGPEWLAVLADLTAMTDSFRLRYRRLVATNSAIIAVADEPNRISAIRGQLRPVLRVPGSLTAGELAHMTLFRYTSPLRDPASLMNWLATAEFDISVDVSELVVVRERIFPSLDYEVLHRLPLRRQ